MVFLVSFYRPTFPKNFIFSVKHSNHPLTGKSIGNGTKDASAVGQVADVGVLKRFQCVRGVDGCITVRVYGCCSIGSECVSGAALRVMGTGHFVGEAHNFRALSAFFQRRARNYEAVLIVVPNCVKQRDTKAKRV